MNYEATINGLNVHAHYTEKSLEEVFLPLLKRLQKMQKTKGKRILVFLAAPPAAGKSTLLSFLEDYAGKVLPEMKLNSIGMDGFHHYQEYLLSHTTERDGKTISMVEIKGAPITFDRERLTAFIERVSQGETMGWPTYDRLLHNPKEDAVTIDGDVVLLEGNYLLLDQDGWRDLKNYADYTISIEADILDLKDRLVERRVATGTPYEKAIAFVERSDLHNARLILEHLLDADLKLFMKKNGEYCIR